MFEVELNDQVPDCHERVYDQALMNIAIKEGKISKIINALKPDKSQGPDRIHPRVLKETHLNLNLNSLLVKRHTDNPSPGAVTGEISP